MTVTDEDTVRMLRTALLAASDDPSGALPDRLLAGVRKRRKSRRAAQAVGTAVLAGAAGGLVLVAVPGWLPAGGEPTDGLIAAPAGPDRDLAGAEAVVEGPPSRAGAVTRDQAARAGLDAEPQCQSQAVRGAVQLGEPGAPPPELVASYLTDTAGFEAWTSEYSGGVSFYRNGSPFGDGLVALCWFEGDIPPDRSVPTGPDDPRHRLLAIQLDGPGTGPRLDMISEEPISVLAPPAPDSPPPDVARQGQTVHPQPAGVAVVEQMRAPQRPVTCLEREIDWTGC